MFSYHQNTMKKSLWIQELRKLVLVEIVGFFPKSSTNQKSKLHDENILFKKRSLKIRKIQYKQYNTIQYKLFFMEKQCFSTLEKR